MRNLETQSNVNFHPMQMKIRLFNMMGWYLIEISLFVSFSTRDLLNTHIGTGEIAKGLATTRTCPLNLYLWGEAMVTHTFTVYSEMVQIIEHLK